MQSLIIGILIVVIILILTCWYWRKEGFSNVSRDRVYTADQNSNTVSVIDPASNKLLGRINLGKSRFQGILSPLYAGEINVHGLGFAPDGKHICVVSHGTHSVNIIDTATNKVVARKYVGTAPHECFYTADGKEVWVAVRGENYLSVLDARPEAGTPSDNIPTLREKGRVRTVQGPGMVIFSSDGKYAYANNSFNAVFQMIDVKKRKVIKTLKNLKSKFSPFLFFSPDEKEIWLTHKDSGYITRIKDVGNPDKIHVAETVRTGLVTNHLFPIRKGNDLFIYVAVGGEDLVKVYKAGTKGRPTTLVAQIPVAARPHGIWSNAPRRGAEATRLYVGAENGDSVTVIEADTNKVVDVIPIGQAPQALIYVPKAVNKAHEGRGNLEDLSEPRPTNFLLYAPNRPHTPRGFVGLRTSGEVDLFTLNAFGLDPRAHYNLYLQVPPTNKYTELAQFVTNDDGMGHVRTVGPLRDVFMQPRRWKVSIVPEDSDPSPKTTILESRGPNTTIAIKHKKYTPEI